MLTILVCIMALPGSAFAADAHVESPAWPKPTSESRPWTYWWWMGSAVDRTNITRQLEQFRDAGLGGVHVIPIYGAKGYEDRYLDYLSPGWLEMLAHTVSEARRLGMDVDMTTGSGWCFGGPHVADEEANASVQVKRFGTADNQPLTNTVNPETLQCVVARGPDGAIVDLTRKVTPTGQIRWTPPGGSWEFFAVSQRPSGQKVKRAGPGGQGHMLNLFYAEAVKHYMKWFDEAFNQYSGPKPRAMYHDSYEYRSDWSPDLFSRFAEWRGYRLESEIPTLFGGGDPDRVIRVRTDYRETLSDLMIESAMPVWVEWSRRKGFITRNEAHGAPGNWLDLYALADIPETEMFHTDRNLLISKFASSAAHLSGKRFTSAETGTWLKEHFTESLADMKYLLDDLFLSGVNHVFYHGACYSPEEAPWPGWLFYASYEMNPRNSIWRDVGALNAYATRCQSVLQAGAPDSDVLLYWPIHDYWNSTTGLVRNMSVHARDWFEAQPVGKTAARLWEQGYAFDYISDRQVRSLQVVNGILVPGPEGRAASPRPGYKALLVPETQTMPEKALEALARLAQAGANIIFEKQLPRDVPGLGPLDERRKLFRESREILTLHSMGPGITTPALGTGRVWIGDVVPALEQAKVPREPLSDHPGLMTIRRSAGDARFYFLANRSAAPVADWIPLAKLAPRVCAMDPLSGRVGAATVRGDGAGQSVWLRLLPGESIILRCSERALPNLEPWPDWQPRGPAPRQLSGPWTVRFIAGGPKLPAAFETSNLSSWTTLKDPHAEEFAGTALYRLEFKLPAEETGPWRLDLGNVSQSARVRLNGRNLGTLFVPPFRVTAEHLKPGPNVLEVEVTNVSANRIRGLDRRGVKWKNFQDINFVNINYRPFDASAWPLTDSGLLGPVTLIQVRQGL